MLIPWRLSVGLAVCLLLASGGPTRGGEFDVELVPHLAIYDLTLESADPAAGIDGFDGRLVFEARGSSCMGYETATRFVGRIDGTQGSVVTDTRSETTEDPNLGSFAFTTRRFAGDELVEETEGAVTRRTGDLVLELSQPNRATLLLPDDTVFPSQHMRMILDAAEAGERIVTTPVFDGSETGRTVYETTAVIGEKRPPLGDAPAGELDAEAAAAMSQWASWPVTIAYFDLESDTPDVPAYQFTYDLFANGISRSLRLDYGEFVLAGRILSLTLGDPPDCSL